MPQSHKDDGLVEKHVIEIQEVTLVLEVLPSAVGAQLRMDQLFIDF